MSLAGVGRLPDADDRFRALLASRLATPFAWGVHDCALWAADAIAAQTGQDPCAPLRGAYSDATSAARVLRQWRGLRGVARQVLGCPLSAPLLARMGDVGYTRSGALAVCVGAWWAAPTRRGMGQLPLGDALLAWRVGHA